MSRKWQETFRSTNHIPIDSGSHHSTHEVFPFRLTLNGLELPKATPSSEFQLRVSFFDFSIASFFGKPWLSQWVRSTSSAIDFNQLVFFVVPFKGPNNTVLAIEVLEKQLAIVKTSYWSAFPVFSQQQDTKTKSGDKSDLFLGSIKSLLYLKEYPQASTKLSKLIGGKLVYSLTPHKPLLKVINWLPENVIIDGKETIPGLVKSENGVTLESPITQPAVPMSIDNLTVSFGSLGDTFESNLCAMVNRERFFSENRASDGSTLVVAERRLHVGVHNGLTYLHEPQVAQLRTYAESETGSLSRKRSSKLSRRTSSLDMRNLSNITGLKLTNRVEITDLAEDPGLALVFAVEYVLSALNVQNFTPKEVMVGWSVWSPFAQDPAKRKSTEIPLISGPVRNPLDALLFRDSYRTISGSQNQSAMIRFEMQISEAPVHYHNQGLTTSAIPQYSRESMERSVRSGFTGQSNQEFPASPTSVESRSEPDTNQTSSPIPPPRTGRAPLAKAVPKKLLQFEDQFSSSNQLVPYQSLAASQSMIASPNAMAISQFGSYFPFGASANYQNSVAQFGFLHPPQFNQSLMIPDMREMPTQGYQAPILALQQQSLSSMTISRGAFAILSGVNFQPILDYKSDTAELVEPNDRIGVNLTSEMSDQFKCSEIILQFMALGRSKTTEVLPQSVFFTFQFYRFPQINTEKLLVSNKKGDSSMLPFILRRLDKSGALLSSSPGYQVRFVVDPQTLSGDEHQVFLRYMYEGHLNVDVWDSDSLILLGSCLIPLKVLLRSGKPAVQSYLELPVVSTDFHEESDEHSEIGVVVQSRLFVRVANVGYPVSLSDGEGLSLNTSVVTQKLYRYGQRRGHSGSRYVVKAETLVSNDATLRENLHFMRSRPTVNTDDLNFDEKKKRKLERMKNLRRIEEVANFKSDKSSRLELIEDIQTLKSARNRRKHMTIMTALMESLTTYHTIFPSLGSAEFFEFLLRNPFNEPTALLVEISDPELKLLSDPIEWQFFKQMYNLATPMDESLINLDSKALGITVNQSTSVVFLKPKENAYIPFKYQSFSALESLHGSNSVEPSIEGKQSLLLQSQTIKVGFKHANSKEPVAMLVLDVEPQPQPIHQVFRFYQAEQTFFAKYIRVAPLTVQAAFASDPHVICEVNQTTSSNQDVFIKVGCGKSPSVKSFSVLLYGDKFLSRPVQMWQIFLHAHQKMEISSTQGHSCHLSLLLKGDRANRMIQFASSNPNELQFQPAEPFLLQANSSVEVTADLSPSQPGRRTTIVTAVDVELHQLVKSWMVLTTVNEPNITKAFQVRLPLSNDLIVNKKISFKNPYAARRRFVVSSSDERYLSVKEPKFELDAKAVGTVQLRFAPQNFRQAQEIFLYINDEEGKNEETYGVKILVDM